MLFSIGFALYQFYVNNLRADRRLQWLARLFANPLLVSGVNIEPMFSDVKTRGFGLEDTHLRPRPRLSWFQRELRKLLRFAELGRPLPCFEPP